MCEFIGNYWLGYAHRTNNDQPTTNTSNKGAGTNRIKVKINKELKEDRFNAAADEKRTS
jgi:hypothetical protein